MDIEYKINQINSRYDEILEIYNKKGFEFAKIEAKKYQEALHSYRQGNLNQEVFMKVLESFEKGEKINHFSANNHFIL